ncbi:MAG: 3-deoxy-manno-octulosonate cytidylyltransferase [Leptospiraceae bacterium]|nr:3-deoxy-manno-octulosonate cytidylyltransferase [Leptospiraceae bacterium]MCP5496877.1 3-deoxy-manno-octulosonate cytidylyltransferase [Leptospiraceae bacterium]
MLKILGVIPARYGSTRFPGKPLSIIGNKTMIEWTYLNSKKSKLLTDVIVATDDNVIHKTVMEFGGKSMLTSTEHESGTDRIIEVTEKMDSYPIILNIQGDEPGISHNLIDGVIDLKLKNRNWEMTTAATQISNKNELGDPNRVKVIFDNNLRALYFSRSPIPSMFKKEVTAYRHLGIYCYERDFLLSYNSLPKSSLEASESLEQLRAVQAGYNIGVFLTEHSTLSVDTLEDLEIVRREFSKNNDWT